MADDPGSSLPLSPEVEGAGGNACEAVPGLSAEENTIQPRVGWKQKR